MTVIAFELHVSLGSQNCKPGIFQRIVTLGKVDYFSDYDAIEIGSSSMWDICSFP